MLHNALNSMKAKRLDAGKYADGQGLWLIKRNKFQGKWIVRVVVGGKRREMGLGPWPDVSIAEARQNAAQARKLVRKGQDPILERQRERAKLRARLTVEQAIEGCFKARQAELKGDGKAGRWMSPLKNWVVPKIGSLSIEDIDQHALVSVPQPIWHSKATTARKCLNRMNMTLKHAAALGLDVDLQAVLKAKALLGKQRHKVEHIPSMPYDEVPDFYQSLCMSKSNSYLALRFLILTVARSAEVRFATFDEIDGNVWTISAERTKQGKEHKIPLSDEALLIVEVVREKFGGKGFLFQASSGKQLSDTAMNMIMKRRNHDYRPHGFRSSFRTWAETETDADWETKEMCLGHTVGNSVERAYQRSDLLKKRQTLLSLWAAFNQSASRE